MTEAARKQDGFLLPGERIDFDQDDQSPNGAVSDSVINEKYNKGEIRIVTEQARYPLNTVSKIFSDEAYSLNPEYQRRHRWETDRKSRLIESFIMNVPIPPVFLYEYDYSKYEVMDGLQRLTAIHDFYSGVFELSGLTEWPELNGKTYHTLPDRVRDGINRRYLSSVILLKETAEDDLEAIRLKKIVFERINSGGVKLDGQETRNAIFNGRMNQLCIKLSKNPSLCRLWGIPVPNQKEMQTGEASEERLRNKDFSRMKDVELVLRFFAHRQRHRLIKNGETMEKYYDRFLDKGNKFPDHTLEELSALFEKTILFAENLLGKRAFQLYRKKEKTGKETWIWRRGATTLVYDPLMFTLSRLLDKEDKLLGKKSEIQGSWGDFFKQNHSMFEGRNVHNTAIVEREEKLHGFFAQFGE